MINFKQILFPLFSAFLAYRSYIVVGNLIASQPASLSVKEAWLVAFLLNLYITGCFAFLGFVFTTSKLMPKKYFEIKNESVLKKVYKVCGVKYFKIFLLVAFWGKKGNQKRYFDGTREGLQNFIFQTHQSEFGHILPFTIIQILAIFLVLRGFTVLGAAMTLINIIGNLYPVILQRYHRMRIERISQRTNK